MKQRGFGLLLYVIAAGVALAAVAAGIGWIYESGYTAGERAVRLEWTEAIQDQHALEEKQIDKAATGLEVTRAKERVVFRDVEKLVERIVDRPIYRNVCLDPDGLRVANCAIRGQSPDRCQPDDPVPGPEPARGRDGGRGLALDYGDRGVLSGLLGEAPEPG